MCGAYFEPIVRVFAGEEIICLQRQLLHARKTFLNVWTNLDELFRWLLEFIVSEY